jgi:geranylgeranyl pyrophosphate synthase
MVATPPNQEFVSVIARPAFWEGYVDVEGSRAGRPVRGQGYVERNGFGVAETLEEFFAEVSKATRESIEKFVPREPSYTQVRGFVASAAHDHYMRGVDVDRFARALIRPVRDIVDRGGKAWRSYAPLVCFDLVGGGDAGPHLHWLGAPELLHVGALIVDDVEDRSPIRRGGPSCHELYGDALAINAGTSCYFLGQKILLETAPDLLTPDERLAIYDMYFEAMRAAHTGQALDLIGFEDLVESVVESGDSLPLEERVLAVHRLKTAVPASTLARMGAVVGRGTPEQIKAVGGFFESLGLAFQIVDDVLNIRGFKGGLKRACEDITHGKVTYPLAKTLGRVDATTRQELWTLVRSRPQEPAVIAQVVRTMEGSGAVDEAAAFASELVEAAWRDFDPVFEDSIPKLMLRAMGWYVLERHY